MGRSGGCGRAVWWPEEGSSDPVCESQESPATNHEKAGSQARPSSFSTAGAWIHRGRDPRAFGPVPTESVLSSPVMAPLIKWCDSERSDLRSHTVRAPTPPASRHLQKILPGRSGEHERRPETVPGAPRVAGGREVHAADQTLDYWRFLCQTDPRSRHLGCSGSREKSMSRLSIQGASCPCALGRSRRVVPEGRQSQRSVPFRALSERITCPGMGRKS
jgi:hypothetical protein